MSQRSRIKQLNQKIGYYKGFGHTLDSQTKNILWYELEYCFGTTNDPELIELRWLKVGKPDSTEHQKCKVYMEQSGADAPGASVQDWLALLYLAKSVASDLPIGTRLIYLYRASKHGQADTFKEPLGIVKVDGDIKINNQIVLGLIFKYCQLYEVVEGKKVTISKRTN